MKVTLLHNTPLYIADMAIGKCWDRPTKGNKVNTKRIDRVANKNKHASTIEHLNYTYDIDGISRALLQELARHRHASLAVKSSRYTLGELKDTMTSDELDLFLVQTGNLAVDKASREALRDVRQNLNKGIANDLIKYSLPESYKTSLVYTINARSLQNLLQLRTAPSALYEFRVLANRLYQALPEDHQFLFKGCLYDTETDTVTR